MAFTINTNVSSMQAQEYLRVTGEFQAKTINRVTSGLRIVSSGDDAAGLAVANSFRSDQAVLSQGIRNANDGLATLQTIDGGINNISKLLDRARSLATQSASGTFNGDRAVLDEEFQSVLSEIDRQAKAIGLNLGGDFAENLTVFIGGGRGNSGSEVVSNGSVSVDLTNSTVDSQSLGLSSYAAQGVTNLDDAANFAAIKNGATSMTIGFSGPGYDDQVVTVNLNGVNDLEGLVNAVSAAIATSAAGTDSNSTAFRNANITASISADGESFALNSSTSAFMVKEGDAASRAFLGTDAATVAKVAGGLQSKAIGFTPIGGGQSQVITVSTTDDAGTLHSKDITLNGALTADTAADAINTALSGTGNAELMKIVAAESGSGLNEISFAGLRNFQITVQAPSTGGQGLAGPGATASSALVTGGGNVAIATKSGAEDAVNKLNDAVSQLGVAQAVVGKGQNQFNYAVSLASTQLTNLAASESRIRDADLALEAANLTRAQILQQAGIAALAQANSAPQAVLSLLRG